MTSKDLDRITDNVNNTLTDEKGNELFQNYLSRSQFVDGLANLSVYNECSEILKEQNQSEEPLESLITKVRRVKDIIEERDVNIAFRTMKGFNTENREQLLNVLKDTKEQCQDNLRILHKDFVRCVLKCKNALT